ncbi:hypothetical protein Q4I28_003966 [Leishmania naiffi]|uniref:Uncharacterized protein n=1 Tax=Leishmania naiffi TaxID=5678 RepID=A0AAW3BTX0_9TRYP
MHPHLLSQSTANAPTMGVRPAGRAPAALASVPQHSPLTKLSRRLQARPATTSISPRSLATRVRGSRENTPLKQRVLAERRTLATPHRQTNGSPAAIPRGSDAPPVHVRVNTTVSVARRCMSSLPRTTRRMAIAPPRRSSSLATPLSKKSRSPSRATPRSASQLTTRPPQVPPITRCCASTLTKAKQQHRPSASRHIPNAPSATVSNTCIPRPRHASTDAGFGGHANEPFATYAWLPSSLASRENVEPLSTMPMPSSAFNRSSAAPSTRSATPPTISAATLRNVCGAVQPTPTPLQVHAAHRCKLHPGLTCSLRAASSIEPAFLIHEIPPASALVLPDSNDAQLRQLFATLFVRTSDSTWSLHRHILPFLAARQNCIMPVLPSQVAEFVGFADHSDGGLQVKERTGVAGDTHNERSLCDGPRATKAMSRFASQLCYWFVYVGVIGSSEAINWDTLLMPLESTSAPSRRSFLWDNDTAGSTAAARAPMTRSNSPSVHPATPEKQPCYRSPHQSLSNFPAVSSPTQCVGTVTEVPIQCQHRRMPDDGDDEDEENSPTSTMLWHTDQLDNSTLSFTATSPVASVEFRSVVKVPPVVQEVVFVRGYKVLQALLANREAQLAHIKEGPMAVLLRAIGTAAGAEKPTGTNLEQSAHCLAEPHPSVIRTVYRRVRFYLRLHAFVRELCVYLRAHQVRPWQRESYILESVVSSRLRVTASFASVDALMAGKVNMSTIAETSTGGGGRWKPVRDALVKGVLCAALHAASTRVSANSLQTLLVLQHADATHVVLRAAEAIRRDVTGEGLPHAPNAVVASSSFPSSHSCEVSTSESTTSSRLPVQLLRIFPLPRWSSLAQPGTASPKHATSFDRVASWALGFALALAILSNFLLIFGAQLVWTSWWTTSREASANGDTAQHLHVLHRTWMLSFVKECSIILLLLACTARVAHRAGEVVASIEVTHAVVTAQSAALTRASEGWLQVAWALHSGNTVAAHAVQRCMDRLRLVGNAVDDFEAAPLGLRHALSCGMWSRYWFVAFMAALVTRTIKMSLHLGQYVELTAVVMLAWGTSVARVCETRQQRRRALAWWLYCQATTAESFAEDLLRIAGDRCSEALSSGTAADKKGGSAARGLLSSDCASLPTLCTISLPMLEELAKVACLVEWSEGRLLPRYQGSHGTSPANLAELTTQWFWEQLCGHAAPTYSKGVSSVAVVETTMWACRRSLETEQRQRGAAPLPVAEAVAYVLPWALDYEKALPPLTGALEGCHDYQVSEVLAPFAAAASRDASADAHAPPHRSFSPLSSHIFQENSAVDASPPLDVTLRRLPYLTQLQGRLVVCTAFVLASLRAAPRAMSEAVGGCSASFSTYMGERTYTLLVYLVHSQLYVTPSLWCTKGSERASAARWRQAATRTRDTLQLLQRVTLLAQQRDVRDPPVGRAYAAVLPSVLHALFR